MPLDLHQTRLYARQIALPSVGSEGQQRLAAATVVVFRRETDPVGDAASPAETAAVYLRGAGVGRVTVVAMPGDPRDVGSWQASLAGADVALRFALDDDGLLPAAIEAGVPLIVGRVANDTIDLLALRQHGGCAHRRPARPAEAAAAAPSPGAAATVLATLAATECLWMLIDPARVPVARRLRLPLTGAPPTCDEIPWPPRCPLCAASGAADAAKTKTNPS